MRLKNSNSWGGFQVARLHLSQDECGESVSLFLFSCGISIFTPACLIYLRSCGNPSPFSLASLSRRNDLPTDAQGKRGCPE